MDVAIRRLVVQVLELDEMMDNTKKRYGEGIQCPFCQPDYQGDRPDSCICDMINKKKQTLKELLQRMLDELN